MCEQMTHTHLTGFLHATRIKHTRLVDLVIKVLVLERGVDKEVTPRAMLGGMTPPFYEYTH